MAAKPYFTTTALVESVKRRISFPLSQQTFTYDDIVAFCNEELVLSAVPSIMIEHEEFFVYKRIIPLVDNVSRYVIPDRAMAMALRDMKYSDTNGNFFDTSRIAPDDKAYFQNNNGFNGVITHYYLEGNEVVLTPQVVSGATGNLNMFFFLRPNQLVRDDRASKILHFENFITISDNTLLSAGDRIIITTDNETPNPTVVTLIAVIGAPGVNEFEIGANDNITTINLAAAVNASGLPGFIATTVLNVCTLTYTSIATTFQIVPVVTSGYTIDTDSVFIHFDQLSSTYTDPDTDITSPLYVVGEFVDFLQTNPGHRTFTYDVTLQAINGSVGKFLVSELQTWLANASGGTLEYWPIKIGDYICLANECIIPQIPPELHSALAERAAGRILMATGDKEGYAVSQAKVQEMDAKQATLIGSRVESSVNKVFNRNSLLRLGKSRGRW